MSIYSEEYEELLAKHIDAIGMLRQSIRDHNALVRALQDEKERRDELFGLLLQARGMLASYVIRDVLDSAFQPLYVRLHSVDRG